MGRPFYLIRSGSGDLLSMQIFIQTTLVNCHGELVSYLNSRLLNRYVDGRLTRTIVMYRRLPTTAKHVEWMAAVKGWMMVSQPPDQIRRQVQQRVRRPTDGWMNSVGQWLDSNPCKGANQCAISTMYLAEVEPSFLKLLSVLLITYQLR